MSAPELLTLEQAAAMLNMSGSNLMGIVKRGQLKPVMRGWQQRFRLADVAALAPSRREE